MEDAVRASEEDFERTLRASYAFWSSHFKIGDSRLPLDCINLKACLKDTPAFLADGLIAPGKPFSFVSETHSGDLAISGKSIWRTSEVGSSCQTDPKTFSFELDLGVKEPRHVEISEDAPLSNWPGVHDLDGYDEGNYISVLFLVWTYILSAKWAELLGRSEAHECTAKYSTCIDKDVTSYVRQNMIELDMPTDECKTDVIWWNGIITEGCTWEAPAEHRLEIMSSPSSVSDVVEIDIPPNASEAELRWWECVLSGNPAWETYVEYKSDKFLSPWSVSISGPITMRPRQRSQSVTFATLDPPSSATAIQYLTRFCMYHRLYAQCSAALSAALFIRDPLSQKHDRPILPIPRSAMSSDGSPVAQSTKPIAAMMSENETLLPYYMTLSSGMEVTMAGMKNILFNPEIKCNLIDAWLNPFFAIFNPVMESGDLTRVLNGLSAREPRFASLWLGATIMGVVPALMSCAEYGDMEAVPEAEAWMGSRTSFLTLKPAVYGQDVESVSREEECRLLFLVTPSDGGDFHGYFSSLQWKPFGRTMLCDAELELREHLHCGCHAFEYESWGWKLDDWSVIEDTGMNVRFGSSLSAPGLPSGRLPDKDTSILAAGPDFPPIPADCEYDLYAQWRAEETTRGIFDWLRFDGWPISEKAIYEHPWIAIEWGDEDAPYSDGSVVAGGGVDRVEKWLSGVQMESDTDMDRQWGLQTVRRKFICS